MKTCLLVSYGPVPTLEYQQVEGGGMRIFGLAEGLLKNGIDVTIAVHENYPQKQKVYQGVKLINWTKDNEFVKTLNSYDSVIASYSLGDFSTFISSSIGSKTQFIVDSYVPSYIEVSAREPHDIERELSNYFVDLATYNNTLSRGDYYLVANSAQEAFYTGVLASLGSINPATYKDDRILLAPFGISSEELISEKNPYRALGIKKSEFVVLWFGGMYPWFKIEGYFDAIKKLSENHTDFKFVFVGAKNPRNNHPDFIKQYDYSVRFVEQNNLHRNVVFVDWVDFKDRGNWYSNADLIISLNKPAKENVFSWRTRVMDFVWGNAIILTNGGDPLSETLIEHNAAIKLAGIDADSIIRAILEVKNNPRVLSQLRENLLTLKPMYYWENITKKLSDIIKLNILPYEDELVLRSKIGVPSYYNVTLQPQRTNQLLRIPRIVKKVLRHARDKGVKRTARVAAGTIQSRAKILISKNSQPSQFIFISHPIDNTGGPLVLIDIVKEYTKKYGSNRIRVIAPSVTPNHVTTFKKMGIKVEQAVSGAGRRLVSIQLGIRPDDFVFINTSAVYPDYINFVLDALKTNKLKKAHWFIHEDLEQCRGLVYPLKGKLANYLQQDKLALFFPSKKTKKAFVNVLGDRGLFIMTMRSDIPSRMKHGKDEKDFNQINFFLSGTTPDGRKGQLITIAALQRFHDVHYLANPKKYRDFSLTLVSVGENDYVSKQVRYIGNSSLGKRIHIFKNMDRLNALEVASKNNVVICSSLHETYALYVAECMLMGHVILRSSVGGVDEQLREGKNGYLIDVTDIKQFANIIEKILNKDKTSNAKLVTMSEKSREIAKNFDSSSYLEQIENI